MGDFSSLGLSDWLVKQCKQLGINKPTPVQENCMPAILQGKTGREYCHIYAYLPEDLWVTVKLVLRMSGRLSLLFTQRSWTSSAALHLHHHCWGVSFHRSGLYGLCQDRQWENSSVRVASAAETLRGPVRHLLPGAHSYQVSAGDRCGHPESQ